MSPSKSLIFQQEQSSKVLEFEELLSNIPYFHSSSSTVLPINNSKSFRAQQQPIVELPSYSSDDPELYMGDDCDDCYGSTLLNSDLLSHLDTRDSETHKPVDSTNIFTRKIESNKRLRMILSHLDEKQQ